MVFLGNLIIVITWLNRTNLKDTGFYFGRKNFTRFLKCQCPCDFESHVHNFESHVNNVSNPHEVTAFQIGALKSINRVSNPGGNIELVKMIPLKLALRDDNNSITHRRDTFRENG